MKDKAHQESQTHERFQRLEDMIRCLTRVVETLSYNATKGEPPLVSHVGVTLGGRDKSWAEWASMTKILLFKQSKLWH